MKKKLLFPLTNALSKWYDCINHLIQSYKKGVSFYGWTIVAGRPVYLQLIEQLELAIITGEYPPGEKIPGVRDLAAQAQVNPNTMQRALAELEARGLLETQRTAGRTVTSDTEKLAQARQSLARKLVHDFYRQASALGLTKAELAALLEQEEG